MRRRPVRGGAVHVRARRHVRVARRRRVRARSIDLWAERTRRSAAATTSTSCWSSRTAAPRSGPRSPIPHGQIYAYDHVPRADRDAAARRRAGRPTPTRAIGSSPTLGGWRAWVPVAPTYPVALSLAPGAACPTCRRSTTTSATSSPPLLVDVLGRLDRLYDRAAALHDVAEPAPDRRREWPDAWFNIEIVSPWRQASIAAVHRRGRGGLRRVLQPRDPRRAGSSASARAPARTLGSLGSLSVLDRRARRSRLVVDSRSSSIRRSVVIARLTAGCAAAGVSSNSRYAAARTATTRATHWFEPQPAAVCAPGRCAGPRPRTGRCRSRRTYIAISRPGRRRLRWSISSSTHAQRRGSTATRTGTSGGTWCPARSRPRQVVGRRSRSAPRQRRSAGRTAPGSTSCPSGRWPGPAGCAGAAQRRPRPQRDARGACATHSPTSDAGEQPAGDAEAALPDLEMRSRSSSN